MATRPRAAEIQGGSNTADGPLVLAARIVEPRRRWWWGSRYLQGKRGAWCYVCNEFITTWSGRWPITVTAQLEIRAHRTAHVQGRLDTPPEETIER